MGGAGRILAGLRFLGTVGGGGGSVVIVIVGGMMQEAGPGGDAGQGIWVVLLEELAALRVLARGRSAFFVRLVQGQVLVEDVEQVLGGRELDRDDAFAVKDGLGGALAQLAALAVGGAVLVE